MIDVTLYPIALLAVILITEVIKRFIKPKFGEIGVQLFIAALSFGIAGFFLVKTWLTPENLATLLSLWVSANGIYQIIGKYFFAPIENALEK